MRARTSKDSKNICVQVYRLLTQTREQELKSIRTRTLSESERSRKAWSSKKQQVEECLVDKKRGGDGACPSTDSRCAQKDAPGPHFKDRYDSRDER